MTKTLIILLTIMLWGCSDKASDYFDPRGNDYAGAHACASCHNEIHENFMHSGHFNSTTAMRMSEIQKNSQIGQLLFQYESGESLEFGKKDTLPAMVLKKNGKSVSTYPLDMRFGFRHAQTFGYWSNHQLYEHSISFYKNPGEWGTSPGFPPDKAYFERRIPKDCFACHTSNASDRPLATRSDQRNYTNLEVTDKIDPNTVVHGIDCERCHGPAKDHANAAKKNNPKEGIAKFSQMTRQQRLDACAVCHSGNDGIKMKSRFDFRPGDALSNFYSPSPNTQYDVHGNQYGLLTQSSCFQKSQAMDCMTCHDPHKDKAASAVAYNNICSSCHAAPKHSAETMASNSKSYLASNCITCHMPAQESRSIKYNVSRDALTRSYQLRTHKIGIYAKQKI